MTLVYKEKTTRQTMTLQLHPLGLLQQTSSWPTWLSQPLTAVYQRLCVRPLARLYLLGPKALGFWQGAQPEQMCSTLTASPATFWTQSLTTRQECHRLIGVHFQSYLVLVETVLLAVAAYKSVKWTGALLRRLVK